MAENNVSYLHIFTYLLTLIKYQNLSHLIIYWDPTLFFFPFSTLVYYPLHKAYLLLLNNSSAFCNHKNSIFGQRLTNKIKKYL